MISPKLNISTVTKTNNSELDEISGKEFKKLIIIMINEIKEDTNK
jgi:hypothetical protein